MNLYNMRNCIPCGLLFVISLEIFYVLYPVTQTLAFTWGWTFADVVLTVTALVSIWMLTPRSPGIHDLMPFLSVASLGVMSSALIRDIDVKIDAILFICVLVELSIFWLREMLANHDRKVVHLVRAVIYLLASVCMCNVERVSLFSSLAAFICLAVSLTSILMLYSQRRLHTVSTFTYRSFQIMQVVTAMGLLNALIISSTQGFIGYLVGTPFVVVFLWLSISEMILLTVMTICIGCREKFMDMLTEKQIEGCSIVATALAFHIIGLGTSILV